MNRPNSRCGRRGARQSSLLASAVSSAVAGLLIACPTANAINFTLNYDAAKTQAPTFDPTGSQLTAIFDYAATVYQDIFEDAHSLTINFWYEDLSGGTVASTVVTGQAAGRTTTANIRVDTKLGTGGAERLFFFDSTPSSNFEFDMQQVLWRDLSASDQAARFNAGAGIPATFEAGYVGLAKATAPADAQNGYDMLTSVIHEMGHTLGMDLLLTSTISETADGDYDYDTINVDGKTLAALNDPSGGLGHLAGNDALMAGGAAATGRRRLPSHTDLFAMAKTSGYASLDVPRREFYSGGDWNTRANWSGNRLPGSADITYVRNSTGVVTATLSNNGNAGTLTVSEASNVATAAFKLDVSNTATIDGLNSDIFVDTGGELEADTVLVQNSAQLSMRGGLLDVNILNNSAEVHNESGNGTLDIANALVNNGTIRVSSGTVTIASANGTVSMSLDGFAFPGNEAGQIVLDGGNLTVQPTMSESFNGGITIAQSCALTMTGDWTLGAASFPSTLSRGVINLSGGGTDLTAGRIKGTGVLTVDGDINVTAGFGMIQGDMIFDSSAAIVVSTGATLELNGAATFNGGSYTGQGILFQVGDGTFAADTTIDTRVYNWDGIEFTTTTVKPGVTLTINSDLIDTFGGFDGTATVNSGTLAVNTAAAWDMNGTLNLHHNSADTPTLNGQIMILSGTVDSTGAALINAPVRGNGGTISTGANSTLTQAGLFRVIAGQTLTKIGGGTYSITGAQSHIGASTLTIDAGTVTMASDAGAAGANLNINANSSVVFSSTQRLASLTIGPAGNSRITSGGNKVIATKDLVIAGGNPPTGRFDLADEDLIVDYTGASPLARIRQYIVSGYNFGIWTGNGLRSSIAFNTTALGYSESSAIFGAGGGVFSGLNVDGTAILVKFTYTGDANLDGQVDVTDLGRLATNWQTSQGWVGGDFNYDGFVDVSDLGALATNWQAGVGSPLGPGSLNEALAAVGLGGISVPEPGVALTAIGLFLGGTLTTGRRSRT